MEHMEGRNVLRCKIIFSYLSLFSGTLSFLWGVILIMYAILGTLPTFINRLMPDVAVVRTFSLVAILSGISGILWKGDRFSRIRSLVGLIFGLFFWALWLIFSRFGE